MQEAIKKYKDALAKLSVFEKQRITQLLNHSSSNGMSRFYLIYEKHSSAENFSNKEWFKHQ